jgi:hypothetical protein
MKLTTAYHGTTKENYDKIMVEGFRAGSYFGYHLEDAVGFGGPWVFQVAFEADKFNNTGPDDWQFRTEKVISPDRIISGCHVEVQKHFKNKLLGDTVFWSNLSEEHKAQNERIGITFDPTIGIREKAKNDSSK